MNSGMDLLSKLQIFLDGLVGNDDKPSKQEILLRSISDELKAEIQQSANDSINTFEGDINKLSSQILEYNETILSKIEGVHKSVLVLSDTVSLLVKQIEQLKLNWSKGDMPSSNEVAMAEKQKRYPQYRYSLMVDSHKPLGFRQDNIKTEEKSCAFQLILADDTHGTYQFVDDADIQIEILSAFNPLVTDSSEYENANGKFSKIKVVSPGVINFESGIWCIIKKQKVEFE